MTVCGFGTRKISPSDCSSGCLLEPEGTFRNEENVLFVRICSLCLNHLQEKKREGPPRLALANGLWIGRVPWQLQQLTFAEQLLVALLYPRVYVFKLYPKKGGRGLETEDLQRGMRGNVSTFDINSDAITNMVQGRLMPRPPAVLASLVTITFIAAGQMSKRWLRSFFRVRRRNIALALEWLKRNNPQYFGDIEINAERLSRLPEDDVPEEIMATVRQSDETNVIEEEADGYAPLEDTLEGYETSKAVRSGGEYSGHNGSLNTNVLSVDSTPDVVPLQATGVIDIDLTKVSSDELMLWGLANLTEEDKEGAYAVRHGRQPVHDFTSKQSSTQGVDNLFEKAFPCLFPYGQGGLEGNRSRGVDFQEHARWLMRYHDRRFRRHETFPFIAFGIMQRRQALMSARLQTTASAFEKDAHLFSQLSIPSLTRAIKREDIHQGDDDTAVRVLKKHVRAISSRVQGSDQSRAQLRTQIWSTAICKGPPTLWITINPCDLHDPIVQVSDTNKTEVENNNNNV